MGKLLVITFQSTNYALKAERVLKKLNIEAKCITSPRSITSDCGLAVLACPDDKNEIEEVLIINKVEVDEYHLMDEL